MRYGRRVPFHSPRWWRASCSCAALPRAVHLFRDDTRVELRPAVAIQGHRGPRPPDGLALKLDDAHVVVGIRQGGEYVAERIRNRALALEDPVALDPDLVR